MEESGKGRQGRYFKRWLKYFLAILFLPITIVVCVYRYPYLSLATRKKAVLGILVIYALIVIAQPALEEMQPQEDVKDAALADVAAATTPGDWLLPGGTCLLNENAELFLQDVSLYWLRILLEDETLTGQPAEWDISLRGTTYRVKGTAVSAKGKELPFTITVEAQSEDRRLRCRSIVIDGVTYTNTPLERRKIYLQIPAERG